MAFAARCRRFVKSFCPPQAWVQAALRFLATATTLAAQRIGERKPRERSGRWTQPIRIFTTRCGKSVIKSHTAREQSGAIIILNDKDTGTKPDYGTKTAGQAGPPGTGSLRGQDLLVLPKALDLHHGLLSKAGTLVCDSSTFQPLFMRELRPRQMAAESRLSYATTSTRPLEGGRIRMGRAHTPRRL